MSFGLGLLTGFGLGTCLGVVALVLSHDGR